MPRRVGKKQTLPGMTEDHADPSEASALSDQILAAEAERQAELAAEPVILDDEQLPGVGAKEISVKEAISIGGVSTIVLLGALDATDALGISALGLLGPDIQESLGVSDAVLGTITAGGNVFIVAGGLLLSRIADNSNRVRLVALATIFWSAMTLLLGFMQTAFWFFIVNCAIAFGRSQTHPVQGAIMADSYPIEARARVYAAKDVAGRSGAFIAPLAVGGLVSLIGGDDAWRWGFIAASIPTLIVGAAILFLTDPPRGQFEQRSTIGETLTDMKPGPISLGAAFQRLFKVRTMKWALMAAVALGFSLISDGLFLNLYLDERFELGPFERALANSTPGVIALFMIPFVAKWYDGFYRRTPPQAMALLGALFFPMAFFTVLQLLMPSPVSFAVMTGLKALFAAPALSLLGPTLANINPYRMRALGSAIGTSLVFGVGGLGGATLMGLISDATSPRTALLAVVPGAMIVGGLLTINGARHIRADLTLVVEEIQEEKAERDRMRADPSDIPVLQLHNIDFSYGPVQVLFDVDLEVARGETLALLGTNGAGKSTALRVAAGLGIPSRGVVRLNGRNMTLASPEQRVREGVFLLPGGQGVFPHLTVLENLETSAAVIRSGAGTKPDIAERLDRAFELFPVLAQRPKALAHDLSGGQQQMLALARVIMHDPEVLIIDELSLGLAPVVVQDLLTVVQRLRDAGQTMIIVEQSLNVALTLADRAVFMEKGHVRFTGSAQSLLERDDLARAVFLGRDAATGRQTNPDET